MFRWQFKDEDQLLQIDVRGPITLDEATLARTAVLNSVGIGFFMESDVLDDIEAGRLSAPAGRMDAQDLASLSLLSKPSQSAGCISGFR